ncbi:MAG: Cytochrome c551 peroxidase [Bryobacteraceae bacterium]|nr:Cytochrome c551 peroxidase [Bryobacteraceae bacterium]
MALAAGVTAPLGLDSYLPVPEDNPITREKAALGRALFHEKMLSRDRTVACASCHEEEKAFSDGKPLAVGIEGRVGTRRSPAIVNRVFGKSFFWDGRAKSLEEQALQPIPNPKEMDLPLAEAVERLRRSAYAEDFRKVFAREVNAEDLGRAVATYVRTILSGDSPYDRYMAGDQGAMTAEAREGLRLFRGKAGCVRCHVGFNFTDERRHNTGAGKIDTDGLFKTPTLREVARHAPYMHDGSMASLRDVIEFYDKGGKANPRLDPEIRELKLTDGEKKALAAFLESLSGRLTEGFH